MQVYTSNDRTKEIIHRLYSLLHEFEKHLDDDHIRPKVQGLLPIYAYASSLDLRNSLFPKDTVDDPTSRLLHFCLLNPHRILSGEELAFVAGDWRWDSYMKDLHFKFGWPVVCGPTAVQLVEDREYSLDGVDIEYLRPNDYVLIDTIQDRGAAFRWYIAKRIRKKVKDPTKAISKYLKENVGYPVFAEEIRYVSNDYPRWSKFLKEMRTEYGWPIFSRNTGRPGLSVGMYILEDDRQSPCHDQKISDETRLALWERDQFRCRQCGWSQENYSASNRKHIQLHHLKENPVSTDDIVTLCSVCHETLHTALDEFEKARFFTWLESGKP